MPERAKKKYIWEYNNMASVKEHSSNRILYSPIKNYIHFTKSISQEKKEYDAIND